MHRRTPVPPPGLHRVLALPDEIEVLDLTLGPMDPAGPWWWGRYDEDRRGVYTTALFAGQRTLHVGVDLGAPAGTSVHAFTDGVIEHAGYNPAAGDYGHTLVTRHLLDGAPLWALWGHLSAASTARWAPGHAFAAGDVLAWLGERHENGGWAPHLHLQLARARPVTHDLPGAVDPVDRAAALRAYPDPSRVLGAFSSSTSNVSSSE